MTDVLLIMLVASLLFYASQLTELTYLAQQSSYQVGGFFRHHFHRLLRFPDAVTVLCSLIALVAWVVQLNWLALVASVGVAGLGVFQFVAWGKQGKSLKLPLVWTPRARRLVTAYVFCAVVELAIFWLWIPGLLLVPAAVAVLNMGISLLLTKPAEMYIQVGFKRKANQRLHQLHRLNQLRVVGITGSYGKTSTKFILGAILSAKHDVLVTPSSFNTPMGICKVINGDLAAHHEVFVAEMGARHRGDIRELVKFVQPAYSMITAVGPAHLETMGSIENIAKTKFDLARGTASDGVVVVNGDNEHCVREAGTLERDVLFYGSQFAPHLSAFSKDVHVEGRETVFTLVFPGDGEVSCKTKLLGKHNVVNIVGAALLARRMGLSLDEIEAGIARIEPVEHRLQLIDPGNGVLVIDDAFNANPEGAAMAIEVLGQFTQYRKWMVTPGMVEMGSQSAAIHQTLGRQMASVCDKVILVGKLNSAMMLKGLMEAGFPREQVYIAGSLAEAQSMWQKELRPGDVLLLENDFPDHLEQASG
jgi:UDP-N-acetylmuramoyl-tripeptide--D-alanyl-D-alanine ligase